MAQCSDYCDLKGSKKSATLRMLVDQSNGIAYSYFVSVLGERPDALLALKKSITEQTSKEINKSFINLPLLNDRYLSCNSLIEKPQKVLAERLPGKLQAGPWPRTKQIAMIDEIPRSPLCLGAAGIIV
jgi:hypothetical protein